MTPLAPPATIAFIGLGMMGRPMASRLAGAGFTLRVFDLSQKAVSDFVGSHPSTLATASAKAAAEGAAALITMLPDGKAVWQAVLEGRDAAAEGLGAGALVMDMSSSNPVDTQKLARDLAARGLALLAKDLRTAGEVASHLKLNMPNLRQAVAYWTDADGKLGKAADHTEISRYAEMLAEKEGS